MHAVDLGIWAHLMTCVAVRYDKVASSHRLLHPAKVNKIWEKLAKRTDMLDPNVCMMKVNRFKGSYLKFRLQEKKDKSASKKKLEAWEQQLLMLVCFFCGVQICTCCVQYTFVLCWGVQCVFCSCSDVLLCYQSAGFGAHAQGLHQRRSG